MELKVAAMAGLVLSMFLLVGEIVALRKKVARLRERWRQHFREARFARLLAELCAVVMLVLLQPLLIGGLVIMVLHGFNPQFSHNAAQQLQQKLHTHTN